MSELTEDPALVRKVTLRLLPFLFLLYVVAYLDRVNVGFAKLTMNHLSWFSEAVYGTGAGIFFFGYFLFEVPSNLILRKVGARRWIMRIMITWGIVAMSMMFARSAGSFYLLRFLLGLAEAGFFPGVLLYLTFWFTAKERARVVALLMTANAVAFIFGGPISGKILELAPLLGLSSWQQLFLLEGLPSILLGFVVLAYLPDGPESARWLSQAEKERVLARIAADRLRRAAEAVAIEGDGNDDGGSSAYLRERREGLAAALGQPVVALLCATYFFLDVGMYGISLWLPQIIDDFGHLTKFQVGLLSAVPYVVSGCAMVANAAHSDHTGERRRHVAIAALVGAAGLIGCAFLHTPALSLLSLTVAAAGMWSTLGPFWSIPPRALRNTLALAGGMALVNAVGNLGGFVGPFMVGKLKAMTGEFAVGLCFLAGAVIVAAGFALAADRKAEQVEDEAVALHRASLHDSLASVPAAAAASAVSETELA